jgi:hypothetical protein
LPFMLCIRPISHFLVWSPVIFQVSNRFKKRLNDRLNILILISNQLDGKFLLYIFISILYMFRATLCLSSGESVVSIQHLVHVNLCRWLSGGTGIPDSHLHRVTYTRCFIDAIDSPDDYHKVARNM